MLRVIFVGLTFRYKPNNLNSIVAELLLYSAGLNRRLERHTDLGPGESFVIHAHSIGV